MSARFECPIAWCDGFRAQHGDEGDGPDTWLHSEHPQAVSPSIRLARYQEGSGPISWALLVGHASIEYESAGALVDELRDVALAVQKIQQSDSAASASNDHR